MLEIGISIIALLVSILVILFDACVRISIYNREVHQKHKEHTREVFEAYFKSMLVYLNDDTEVNKTDFIKNYGNALVYMSDIQVVNPHHKRKNDYFN